MVFRCFHLSSVNTTSLHYFFLSILFPTSLAADLFKSLVLPKMFLRRIAAVACPHSKRLFNSLGGHDYASAIQELNKEMESVFGEPPANGLASSGSSSPVNNESHASSSQNMGVSSCELTDTGDSDVSMKESMKQTTTSGCKIKNQELPKVLGHMESGSPPHGQRLFSSSGSNDYTVAIQELIKEMESVLGEPLTSGPASFGSDSHVNNESHASSSQEISERSKLTHTGHSGEAQMVDVSPKENTKRTAIAGCKVMLGKKVFDLVSANQMVKGDVLTVAKIAGISAAKQTSSLIPLCHNISLTHVQVDLRLNHEDFSVTIEGEAATTGKTGVEMEAMTAVSVAGLTVYDMCKAASKDISITDIRLLHKTGGKSGDWSWGQ